MRGSTLLGVGILVAALCGCSKAEPRYGPDYRLSDDDITTYALQARQPSFREGGGRRVIGVHNGTKVVAEFPFLDDGRSTFGIIHYDVRPGEACKRAGGVVRPELVPVAITAAAQPFCVPKVLVQRHIRITPLQ
jgi:hypothetical protein